ncbi:MAG: Lipolytic protein G-D-S-L family [Microgenomates group bacterium GW2011_GWA1_48_10]|uniref:SGNH hydrolase-type esterase domain-containing protein n=1 Tax=Candidatus Gottesmanbacteria bacterium RIFCSPHIGHO2_01_FULL_47_48 TaxID=1798381 RepID=A0A1F6A6C6_9BACT|nr:MAG: Lipolytic protein G-D-S-L family [Microgenomates group bacterium GW2011_GWA1_48_10]OGG19847.1 MAG: hypothetical protein A2721_00490 [Candidatus Gottesmanbacteria bacterium RIFCSPHIGHO2_01_FULL_47_48]
MANDTISYVAVGDSYTVGEGVDREETWPSLLTKHLQEEGLEIELTANVARTGWLTQHVLELQMPLFEKYQPTFATLLIGANDWVQEVSPEQFRTNFLAIVFRMQAVLPDKKKMVALTIPDFSVTRIGEIFGTGREVTTGIKEYNQVLTEVCLENSVSVVDIFPLSQGMKNDPDLVGLDGLHPSAKEYQLWEKEIFPVALELLKEI